MGTGLFFRIRFSNQTGGAVDSCLAYAIGGFSLLLDDASTGRAIIVGIRAYIAFLEFINRYLGKRFRVCHWVDLIGSAWISL
ncbi:hypothetical protein [Pediococcus acidilactici]|uniref:hypothetical protein n=1 Tax=Pediococcus acidilactici TaxID=1254 RepID=UPI003CF7F618